MIISSGINHGRAILSLALYLITSHASREREEVVWGGVGAGFAREGLCGLGWKDR
jgi:hypothetical protein